MRCSSLQSAAASQPPRGFRNSSQHYDLDLLSNNADNDLDNYRNRSTNITIMALLSRVSNYLWSYVSPRKTQKSREKPYRSPPASPANTEKAIRVHQWREKQKLQALERENSLETSELEGDTLIDTSLTDRTPASIRFSSPGADFDDAHETTLVMDEDEYAYEILDGEKYFDAAAVEAYCETKAEEMRDLGWSESAIKLCLKMETKGREPLLPKTWELDFESLPEALFSSRDDKVFIKSASRSNFRGESSDTAFLDSTC